MVTPDEARREPRASGTVLAFDYGERRIGVAVGDLALRLAHPLGRIDAANKDERFRAIGALLAEWQPVLLVVGAPRHLDGTAHAMTETCTRFARQLEGRFGLPVVLVDERLSSREADHDLRASGRGGRQGKAWRDQAAARVILQGYFDQDVSATRS
ncbi:Putative pre-16S rRNA nuclease [Burkholderiales bacterium]|nr:Putative pre-16S rRNA nuclease [Burkholderiales bacterium]